MNLRGNFLLPKGQASNFTSLRYFQFILQAIITFVASVISDINIIDEKSLEVTNSELKENVEMKFEVSVRIVGFHLLAATKQLLQFLCLGSTYFLE